MWAAGARRLLIEAMQEISAGEDRRKLWWRYSRAALDICAAPSSRDRTALVSTVCDRTVTAPHPAARLVGWVVAV